MCTCKDEPHHVVLAYLTLDAITEAVLEFECKSEERQALTTELRNSRQAYKVYHLKGTELYV